MDDDYGPAPKKETVLSMTFSFNTLRKIGFPIYVFIKRCYWTIKALRARKL